MPPQVRLSKILVVSLTIALGVFIVFLLRPKPISLTPSTYLDVERRIELENKARAGDPVAQYELTLFLDDHQQVLSFLKKSADAGYAPAVVTYAVTTMDDDEASGIRAREMMESVAKGGYYPAMVELVSCIEEGECGSASRQAAFSWAVVSRLLLEKKLITQNTLQVDENRIRPKISLEEADVAEHEARRIVDQISKVTGYQKEK